MKKHLPLVVYFGLVFMVTGCGQQPEPGKDRGISGKVTVQKTIHNLPMAELEKTLQEQNVLLSDQSFLKNEVNASYDFVNLMFFTIGDTPILEMNQFNLDAWINPDTMERGATPHGTTSVFQKRSDRWELLEVYHYGG